MSNAMDEAFSWIDGQTDFLRECRAGTVDLTRERPMTMRERNHEKYLKRKREHPDYYTRAARRQRAETRKTNKEALA